MFRALGVVDGLVGDFLGQCLSWVTGFRGIRVGLSGFSLGCRVLSPFFLAFSGLFPLVSGGSGVLSHGAGSGLGFHG